MDLSSWELGKLHLRLLLLPNFSGRGLRTPTVNVSLYGLHTLTKDAPTFPHTKSGNERLQFLMYHMINKHYAPEVSCLLFRATVSLYDNSPWLPLSYMGVRDIFSEGVGWWVFARENPLLPEKFAPLLSTNLPEKKVFPELRKLQPAILMQMFSYMLNQ